MNVKGVIKKKGFTINQVADMMGRNRVTLFQTISGNPTVETLRKIADAIGCRVGDFFTDEMSDSGGGALHVECPYCGKEIKLSVTAQA